jgi:hypothetical protein
MKYPSRVILGRVACASLVLAGTVAGFEPRAAWAATATTTEKGTVSCTIGSFGTYTLAFKTKTTYDNTATAGSSASGSTKAAMTLPAALNSAMYAAGFRSYNGSATQFLFDSSDATPSPYNAASDNTIAVGDTTIVNNASSKIKFKIADLGPFTFTNTGTDAISAGNPSANQFATATVDLYTTTNETGTPISVTATCVVPNATGGGTFVAGTVTVSQ